MSSSKRIVEQDTPGSPVGPGPGTYNVPGAINIAAPSYTAFSSSSKRDPFGTSKKKGPLVTSPSPMAYDVREKLIKNKPVLSSGFNSKTKRFSHEQAWGPLKENWTSPKPFGMQKKAFPKPQSKPVVLETKAVKAPSIPRKHQSYGFEENDTGILVPQIPSYPGYTGLKEDRVGPMDYNPRPERSRRTTDFSKGSNRPSGLNADALAMPGPGYYNTTQSSFDNPNSTSMYNDGSYTMRLNAVRSQKTSSFATNADRSSFLPKSKEVRPEPGSYNLPSAISIKKRPEAYLQNFGSSDSRIAQTVPRSMQLALGPGTYNPLTSDFDKLYARILKNKRLIAKSQHATGIAFNATDKRTAVFEPENLNHVTDATYAPRTNIADQIPKQAKNGAFGSDTQRFNFPDQAYLNPDIVKEPFSDVEEVGNATVGGSDGQRATKGKTRMVLNKLVDAPQPMSSFSYTKERFEDKINQLGPPPGSYDVAPSWTKKGGVPVMKPDPKLDLSRDVRQPAVPDTMPGPGDYTLPSSIKVPKKSRKNVMISTGTRKGPETLGGGAPPPGTYDPIPLYGNFITRSHNVLLSPA